MSSNAWDGTLTPTDGRDWIMPERRAGKRRVIG